MSLCHQQYVPMYVRGFLERHFSAGSLQSSKGSLIEDAFTFFAPSGASGTKPPGQAMGTGREQPPPSFPLALHNGAKPFEVSFSNLFFYKPLISQGSFWKFSSTLTKV